MMLMKTISFPRVIAQSPPMCHFRHLLLLLTLAVVSQITLAENAVLRPEQIHKQVGPCVATIRDIDSHGSGVVITRGGLILTNYHVVASGLPLSITVKVKQDGKWMEKTYENVTVGKVHPEYDLALVQIEDKDATFEPAKLLNAKDQLVTGSQCYAIGSPGGVDGAALEISITEGLVSAAIREIDGLKYIQTSAALNPGNSGGAVVDGQGSVIGIATLRLEQSDNIGFAIPVQGLKMDQFIIPASRKANPELARRYEVEAGRIADLAERLQEDDRAMAILIAASYYRKSMEAVPNDPAPYHNIGIMYFRLQEDEIARRYLERALQIRPLYASSMSTLGVIQARGGGDVTAADGLWFRGVTDKDNPRGASDCAENLAISFIRRKELSAAAYCIKWANILGEPSPQQKQTRSRIWEEGVQSLSENQYLVLTKKETEFSKADLEAFVKDEVSPSKENPQDKEMAPKPPATVDGKPFIEIAKAAAEAAVEIPDGGLTRPLPSKPLDIIMGYAGTCLVMKFPDLKKLGVFDLCQGKIVSYIDLAEEDAVFAAGGRVLLIYLPDAKRFELWDMKDWTKKKEVSLRSELGISAIGMGLLNDDFAIVIRPEGNAQTQDKVAFLSIPDGKLTVPKFNQSGAGIPLAHLFGHLNERAKVLVDDTGTTALINGSGRGLMKLGNRLTVDTSYIHGGSQDTSLVFGGSEIVLNNDVFQADGEKGMFWDAEKNTDQRSQRVFVSGLYGYRGIVEIGRDSREEEAHLKVRSLPHLNEVHTQPIDNETYRKISFGSHKRIYASAYVKRCAIVDEKENTVMLLSLDTVAPAAVGKIAPGELFVRELVFADGTKVAIDNAPDGLSYDQESAEIRWLIPSDHARGKEVNIILLLTDGEGAQSYHVEKIFIP